MRVIYYLAFLGALVLTLGQAFSAQDSPELKPLIDKILKAHGGEAKLNGLQAFVEKTKTTLPGGKTTTWDRYIQLPDQMRQESEFELQGKRVKCVLVFAGDNGWRKMEGEPAMPYRAAFKGRKDPLHHAGPRLWLRLKDPAYTVTPFGDVKVGNRAAFGIMLKSALGPEEKLFFDKQSGLLIKSEQSQLETFYDAYQPADSIPIARKITRKQDGKTTQEIEVVEFKVVEKLDGKLFEKP
jgi:hypothetical protein